MKCGRLFHFWNSNWGIFHSPVYTFFKKTCIIELNTDAETGNSKLGNPSTSFCFSQFRISNFEFHCQNTRSTKCKLLLRFNEECRDGEDSKRKSSVSNCLKKLILPKKLYHNVKSIIRLSLLLFIGHLKNYR